MGFSMACFIRCARTQTFASLVEYVIKSCFQGIEGLTHDRLPLQTRHHNSHFDHKACGVLLEQPCGAAANIYVFFSGAKKNMLGSSTAKNSGCGVTRVDRIPSQLRRQEDT
ncbi:unnamed protein product [Ectocarpus sp. 12 AP-2014]